jgi:hypothetical protein
MRRHKARTSSVQFMEATLTDCKKKLKDVNIWFEPSHFLKNQENIQYKIN